MAENWGEYFRGSDTARAASKLQRERAIEDMRNSPLWALMRKDEPFYDPSVGTTVDPREMRMRAMMNVDAPRVDTEFARDRQTAWDNTVTPAWKFAFETGMRPRDTLIKAMQAAGQDDRLKAAELLARAPLSMVYWPAAAGTPGSPDDWREDARKLGISEGNILAIDLFTDPETYLPVPAPFMAMGKAGRALPAAAKGMEMLRYGDGVPAHLVDRYGEQIRRLRNAPAVTR